jgi:hypothetical protein
MKKVLFLLLATIVSSCGNSPGSKELKINDLGYFATQGFNVLVYSNPYNGGFNDEKTAGIELIHHGV